MQQPQGPIQDIVSFSYLRHSLEERVKRNQSLNDRYNNENKRNYLINNIKNVGYFKSKEALVPKHSYNLNYLDGDMPMDKK
jgi:hypothetical protein